MKVVEILKEIFDSNLFKRNMQNALSTIQSEMQNVQANMAEKDGALKQKDDEANKLKEQIKAMGEKVNVLSKQKQEAQRVAPTLKDRGVGTTKVIEPAKPAASE